MINNDNFLLKEVPNFHPITQRYDQLEFWRIQKRRCIEGYWVSGKWMPGELYYYINFHTILFESGIYKGLGQPWLRDIDWEMFLIYTEAIGFSGFEKDTKYTCDRRYGPEKERAIEDGIITEEEIAKLKYIPAREYLNKIHSEDLGRPLYNNEAKHLLLLGSRGFGKAVPLDTQVVTKTGNVKIDDLEVGNKVIGRDGLETTILSKHYQGVRPVYEFTLSDGRKVESDEEHLWGVYKFGKYKVLTTKEIVESKWRYKHVRSGYSYSYKLPEIEPIQYDKKDLPIDPYIIGCMIGDGTTTGSTLRISTDDSEIVNEFKSRLNDFEIKLDSSTNNWTIVDKVKEYKEIVDKNGRIVPVLINRFTESIKSLKLNKKCYNKFIPKEYKFGSVEQRLELLRGLMDTDGSININGSIEYCSASETLIKDIASLCRSLGIRCQIGKENRIGRTHKLPQGTIHTTNTLMWRLFIRTDLPIFKLTRKLDRIKKRTRNNRVSIVDIRKVKDKETVCITIDNEDKLFLIEDYVPTHNSYASSGLILHNFLFDGAKDYDLYLKLRQDKKPLQSETLVGAIDAKYSGDLLKKVQIAIEHLPDSHTIMEGDKPMFYPSPLYASYTGSMAPGRFVSSDISKSLIHHRTFQDNPLAANGTRPNRAFIDEVGFMSNIMESWGAIESTQAAAEFKRLSIIGMGTGGLTQGGAALYTQEIFYDPESYNCLVFNDEWEDRGKIGYFVSATKALNKFKEGPNKITNEEKALKSINREREEAKQATSRTKLQATIINKPIKPSEIFLRMEGGIFPVADLNNRLADLETVEKNLLNSTYKFEFGLNNGKPIEKFSSKKVIRDYPAKKGMDLNAPVEIFEKPHLDLDGFVPAGRYIAGWDPVAVDGNEDVTRSLQSAFIMDLYTDRIVAEYTARTYLAEEYYENLRRLLMWYNAIVNYENNLTPPYGYFKNKNSLHLMCETPEILKAQSIIKSVGIGNKSLGTTTNAKVISTGLQYSLKWMESQAYNAEEGVRNLDILMSPGLIKELISYDPSINADRVSALIMLMILREDRMRITELGVRKKIKEVSDDPFWNRPLRGYRPNNVFPKSWKQF